MKLIILFILLFLLLHLYLVKPTKIYSHPGENKNETKSEDEPKLRDLAYTLKIIEGGKEYAAQEQYLQTSQIASRLESISKKLDLLQKRQDTKGLQKNVICDNYPDLDIKKNQYMPCSGKKVVKNIKDKNTDILKDYNYFLHNDVKREKINIINIKTLLNKLPDTQKLAKCQSIVRAEGEKYISLVEDLPETCMAFIKS